MRSKKKRERRLWWAGALFLLLPASLAYFLFRSPPPPLTPSPPKIGRLLPALRVDLGALPGEVRVLRTRKPYREKDCAAKHRGLCVQKIPLEEYVEGVVLAEEGIFAHQREGFSSLFRKQSASAAAREAWALQAVAARTYALYAIASRRHRNVPYDIEDTPRDQAYQDVRHPAAAEAVARTAFQVLVDARGRLIPAEYSASCGGRGTWSVLDATQAIACHARCREHSYPGSSHGRGMCQWGSFEFARDGEDLSALLLRYYPGTRFEQVGKRKVRRSLLQSLFEGALPL